MNWHEYFTYDDGAGVLIWKVRPPGHFGSVHACNRTNSEFAGTVAGSDNGQKIFQVKISGETFSVHRIIWEMHNGPIPAGMEVDHIDVDRSNNRISNFRLATKAQNRMNKRRYRNNTSGYKGVRRNGGKWQATIYAGGKAICLGQFHTPEEAHLAYQREAHKYHGEFANIE